MVIETYCRQINPLWNGERLYQETRKIIGGQMQAITFKHWLPHILGPKGMAMLGPYQGYDPSVNPSVSNVFASAALRFGHTLINPSLSRLNDSYEPLSKFPDQVKLIDAFFAPYRLVEEGGIEPLLRGLIFASAKKPKPQQILNSQLTEHLFEMARDISLGRQHFDIKVENSSL